MDLTGHGVSVLFPPLLPFTSSSTWDPGEEGGGAGQLGVGTAGSGEEGP